MNNLKSHNLDSKTVERFGDEWERFDQSELPTAEREQILNRIFLFFLGLHCPLMQWDSIWAVTAGVGRKRWRHELQNYIVLILVLHLLLLGEIWQIIIIVNFTQHQLTRYR